MRLLWLPRCILKHWRNFRQNLISSDGTCVYNRYLIPVDCGDINRVIFTISLILALKSLLPDVKPRIRCRL